MREEGCRTVADELEEERRRVEGTRMQRSCLELKEKRTRVEEQRRRPVA